MKGYKDSKGKFHPIENKGGMRKARGKTTGVRLPAFDFKLPERKETYSELKANIERNYKLREELLQKNEGLATTILANPQSEFNESWREEIKQNKKIVRDVNNDIKSDVRKLTQFEKKQLPDEIKNLMRFL